MIELKPNTIKRIHVDRKILASNKKDGMNRAAITIQTSKGPIKARHVYINGPSTFCQADGVAIKPLSCGARVWVQTHSEIAYEV